MVIEWSASYLKGIPGYFIRLVGFLYAFNERKKIDTHAFSSMIGIIEQAEVYNRLRKIDLNLYYRGMNYAIRGKFLMGRHPI